MVIRLLLLSVALLLGTGGVMAASVEIQLGTTTVEWGKPLRGNLYYYGLPEPDAPDLSAWQQDFFVDPIDLEYTEDADGSAITRQSFRLYARATGKFTMASINWGGLSTQPQKIESTAAVPEEAKITLRIVKPKTRARVGEQLVVMLMLSTSDPRVKPSIELPVVEGLEFTQLRPVKKLKELAVSAGSTQTPLIEHRFGWAITATKSGSYQIDLPPIGYQLHGRNLRRFYIPIINIKVRPLPAYVPANIPVGTLALTSRLISSTNGAMWQLDVESDARLPYGIPELRAELAAVSGVKLAQVLEEVELEIGEEQLITHIHYQLPLPKMVLGESPEVRLNYFDLQTQRVQELAHRLPMVWQYPLWLMLIAAFLGFPVLIYLLNLLWQNWLGYSQRQALRREILNCDNPQQLRKILLKESGQRSLSDWANSSNGETDLAALQRFTQALNQACFLPGVTGQTFQQLKVSAIEISG